MPGGIPLFMPKCVHMPAMICRPELNELPFETAVQGLDEATTGAQLALNARGARLQCALRKTQLNSADHDCRVSRTTRCSIH